MRIANFGPMVISHLECDLHKKLNISRVVCKECLTQILQRSINEFFETPCLQKLITHTERDTQTQLSTYQLPPDE